MTESAARAAVNDISGCNRCGTELAPALLACPSCGTLVHAARLTELSARAQSAEGSADWEDANTAWREALALLPAGSNQHDAVQTRLDAVARKRDASALDQRRATEHGIRSRFGKAGPLVAGTMLLLWKLKFVLVFVLTKAKLLLLGFSKAGTVLSMLAAFGVYWTVWGWKFALGFVLSIYVHEMGHVAALRHYGIDAGAPMFIPGIGAFVRLKQSLRSEWEEAMVGLAGPLWGLGAALGAYVAYRATGNAFWGAIAQTGAWLNLFNLLPVWQLDGARGFRAMSRTHRLLAAGALLAAGLFAGLHLLLLLAAVAAVVAFLKPSAAPDARVLLYYAALVLALAPIAAIEMPGLGR